MPVLAALRELNPAAQLVEYGGKAMREAGVNIIYDIENLGVIGIVEVVKICVDCLGCGIF